MMPPGVPPILLFRTVARNDVGTAQGTKTRVELLEHYHDERTMIAGGRTTEERGSSRLVRSAA